MLQITKQGNSIVVKGLDHALYPYSGTLEIPCNSVITVVDESDIVTFRSASNYDVLFSGLVTDITINGESVTKENVGDKFGALSNVNSDGLTPEQEDKLNNAVQIANYNADKVAQATIDENQNSAIEGLRGNIEGKQDKIDDLNTIREGAEKGATALQNETDPIWTADKGNYYTKSEVNASLETKANKSEIPTVPTNVSAFTNDAGYLTEHQPLKTINGQTIVGSGNIEIQGGVGEETDPIWMADKGNYYTKGETDGLVNEAKTAASSAMSVASSANSIASSAHSMADEALKGLENKANKSEIPSLDGYATKVWVGEQGYLTEHQDISGKLDKTEAAETYQPKGNYLTEETDPVWTAEKGNYYDKGEIDGMFAQADATYQPKGDYATKGEVATEVGNKQDTLISGTTIKTINGESILGSGNIEVQVGGAVDSVNGKTGAVVLTAEELGAATTRDLEGYYTKAETDDLVGNVRTTAEGASSVASTAQSKANEALAKLDSKADKSEIPSLDGYATEQWVEGKGYLTEHQDISGKLDKTEAASTYQPKGDYLTEETDPIWTAEKVNYYTKAEVDEIIGNINNALATLING